MLNARDRTKQFSRDEELQVHQLASCDWTRWKRMGPLVARPSASSSDGLLVAKREVLNNKSPECSCTEPMETGNEGGEPHKRFIAVG